MTQNIPIGAVTSPHAVRVRRVPPVRPVWMRPHVLAIVAGLAAALAGAALLLNPGPVSVQMSSGRYDIGGALLTATAPDTYQGPAGAAMVVSHGGGVTHAGASAVLNGTPMTGSCALPDGSRTERCQFALGGQALAAVDTWTGSGWQRRYDDGRTASIDVAGGRPVPVPFAVGR